MLARTLYTRLSHLRRNVSSPIEPVLLDSANDKSGFVNEVLATGEVIYQQSGTGQGKYIDSRRGSKKARRSGLKQAGTWLR